MNPNHNNKLFSSITLFACSALACAQTTVQTSGQALRQRPGERCDLLLAARTAAPTFIPGIAGPLSLEPSTLVVLRDRRGLDTDLARKLDSLPGKQLAFQRLEHTEQGLRLTPAITVDLRASTRQVDSEAVCRARAERFVASVAGNNMAPTWTEPRVRSARPVLRPDVLGTAYFEFTVEPAGYVVVATGEHDRPIAQWDHASLPPSAVLAQQASSPIAQVYKLDTLSYVAEDAAGEKVAQLNAIPQRLIPTPDGRDWRQEAWRDWQELKSSYRTTYLPLLEGLRLDAAISWVAERTTSIAPMDWSPWSYWYAGSTSEQRNYDQWVENGFYIGCGPVAWAMLIGWIDNRAQFDGRFGHMWGIYRAGGGYGANAIAPLYADAGVDNMVREVHYRVGTFNLFGNGATYPATMGGVGNYLAYRSPGSVRTSFDPAGIPNPYSSYMVESSIKYLGTPAVMGTGWLTHYPLGFIFAQRQQQVLWWTEYQKYVYVNQGWRGTGNTWVDAGSWFSGEILR
jgi:hypothetical protein